MSERLIDYLRHTDRRMKGLATDLDDIRTLYLVNVLVGEIHNTGIKDAVQKVVDEQSNKLGNKEYD